MTEKNPFFGATFAERKATREAAEQEPAAKAVDADVEQVEDKSVKPKRAARKTAKKA